MSHLHWSLACGWRLGLHGHQVYLFTRSRVGLSPHVNFGNLACTQKEASRPARSKESFGENGSKCHVLWQKSFFHFNSCTIDETILSKGSTLFKYSRRLEVRESCPKRQICINDNDKMVLSIKYDSSLTRFASRSLRWFALSSTTCTKNEPFHHLKAIANLVVPSMGQARKASSPIRRRPFNTSKCYKDRAKR